MPFVNPAKSIGHECLSYNVRLRTGFSRDASALTPLCGAASLPFFARSEASETPAGMPRSAGACTSRKKELDLRLRRTTKVEDE